MFPLPMTVKSMICLPFIHVRDIVKPLDSIARIRTSDAFMKALSFHWELMLSKGVLGHDLGSQGDILRRASDSFDSGILESIETELFELSVESLKKAHGKLERRKMLGKTGSEVGEDIQ